MAGIIKAGSQEADALLTAAPPPDEQATAESCLNDARREAEEIVAEAEREAVAIRSAARQAGRQDALRAALRHVETEVEQRTSGTLVALEAVTRQFAEAAESWCCRQERLLVQLACQLARRIVRRELSRDPEITVEWAREALELLAGSRRVWVRLHPDDQALIGEQVAQLAGRLRIAGQLEVVADESVEPGGCLVQNEHGEIDQQLRTQLDRMEEELTD